MKLDEVRGHYEVIGILSYGVQHNKFDHCVSQFPDVYTRVSTYLPWIKKTLKKWSVQD